MSEITEDSDTDPLSFVTPVHDKVFAFNLITVGEVIGALNLIQSKKSPGLDGISTRLLKDAAHIIFNFSLQTTIFPDDWKLAKVTPVRIKMIAETIDQFL